MPKGRNQRKCKAGPYQQQKAASASTVPEVAPRAEMVQPLPVIQLEEVRHLNEDLNHRLRNKTFKTTLSKGRNQRKCKAGPYKQQLTASASTSLEVAPQEEMVQPLPVVQFDRLEVQNHIEDLNNRPRNGTFKTTMRKGRNQRKCKAVPYQQQQTASASTAPEVASQAEMVHSLPVVQFDRLEGQHHTENLNNRPINGTFKTTMLKGRNQRKCKTMSYQQQQTASASTAPEVAPQAEMVQPLTIVQPGGLRMRELIEDMNSRPRKEPSDLFMGMAQEVVQEFITYSHIPWNPASVRCLAEIGEAHYIRAHREGRPFCRMCG